MHRGREKVWEEEEVGLWPSPPIPSFALLLSPCFLAKICTVRRRLQHATGLGGGEGWSLDWLSPVLQVSFRVTK